jgi:GT2 family glycosyltransferase
MKNKKASVLAFVPTRNRYDCLSLCLQSIAAQTRLPDKLIIYDDGEHCDLRKELLYNYIFNVLDLKKIPWQVIYGNGNGQHIGHQIANTRDYDFVWRIDDDEVAEPDVLEKLLDHITPEVGAVAGAVFTPGQTITGTSSGYLTDIFTSNNLQWTPNTGTYSVEHLYSSFLYRSNIATYNLKLSPVAHREETLFTYSLKRKGFKLLVDTSIKTYHYRYPTGGIRDNYNQSMFYHDSDLFKAQLEAWGIKVITVDGGLGDHLIFANLIPDLLKKYSHLIIGCVYPEVFSSYRAVTVAPVSATKTGDNDNIYKFCADHNWTQSILDAYKEMLKL